MDGRAFLDVARELARGTSEAHWRTAAGRAYYALMLEGLAALERWGFVRPRRDQVHTYVRLRCLYGTDPDLQEVGKALDGLGRLRNQADYEVSRSGPFATAARARDAVSRAEQNLLRLARIEADPARLAAAVASIRRAFP